MNIQTLPGSYADAGGRSTFAASKTLASDPVTFTAAEPQDKVEKGDDGGTEIGNGIKFALGGAGGLALMIPAMYAGVLGGAIVGSIFGGGIGPAISTVTTDGALGFLGGIWSSTATFAKAGMFIGGGAGLIGGWKAGTAFGHAVGRVFGAAKEESKPDDLKRLKGVPGLFATVVSGAGLASGIVGGGLIGGGLAATGSIVANGFSLAGMGPAAAIGAGIGAASMGLIGAYGGITAAKTGAKAMTGAYNLASKLWKKTGESEPLPEKEARLEAKEEALKTQEQQLSTRAAGEHQYHQEQTAALDTRERDIEERENDADQREQDIDGNIADAGRQDYEQRFETEKVDNGLTLKEWTERLDSFKAELDEFERTQRERESNLDREIETEGQRRYSEQLKPELDAYEGRLNDFESRLNRFEQEIADRIEREFQQEFQPQKNELERQISDARNDERRASEDKRQAEREFNMAAAALSAAEGDLQSAQRAKSSAANEVNRLSREIASMRTRVNNLNNEINGIRSDIRTVESKLAACR